MSTIVSVDPGTSESAYLVMVDGKPTRWENVENAHVRTLLYNMPKDDDPHFVVESMVSYGTTVGEEVFTTCVWIGRFIEAWEHGRGKPPSFLSRREVKLHICGDSRAKDSGVREALLYRYGGKDVAVGKKKNQGPLYGMSGDCWSALAIATTYHETRSKQKDCA